MTDTAAIARSATIKLAELRQSTIERLVKKNVSQEQLDLLLKTQAAIELLQKLQSGKAR